MYSYEIERFLKENNYRLNVQQIQLVIDRRVNPQVSRVKYSEQDKSYEVWTDDNFYFKFYAVTMRDYYEGIANIISQFKNDYQVQYRLYMSLFGGPLKLECVSPNLEDIFPIMDEKILKDEVLHSRYIVIENTVMNGDYAIYSGYGNKLDYLKWKERMLCSDKVSKLDDCIRR